MKTTLGQMNGAIWIVLAGFVFSLSGCFVHHTKKNIPQPATEKVIHIISVTPQPEGAKNEATSVNITYQDPETSAFTFFQEKKRPCEFHLGEANLVFEKGVPSLILPNASCPS